MQHCKAICILTFASLLLLSTSRNEVSRMQERFYIALTEDGINPITYETPFKLSEIDKLFPSLDVLDPEDEKNNALNRQILEMSTLLALAESSELHVIQAWDVFGEAYLRSTDMGPYG